MNDIEKRARELVAAQYQQGRAKERRLLLDPEVPLHHFGYANQRAIRAIIAALTPPEGYVLVPSELLRMVAGSAYPVSSEIDPRGYRWSEAYLDEVLPQIKAAMLAARPEVSP